VAITETFLRSASHISSVFKLFFVDFFFQFAKWTGIVLRFDSQSVRPKI